MQHIHSLFLSSHINYRTICWNSAPMAAGTSRHCTLLVAFAQFLVPKRLSPKKHWTAVQTVIWLGLKSLISHWTCLNTLIIISHFHFKSLLLSVTQMSSVSRARDNVLHINAEEHFVSLLSHYSRTAALNDFSSAQGNFNFKKPV